MKRNLFVVRSVYCHSVIVIEDVGDVLDVVANAMERFPLARSSPVR